jgi:hypothetical protein
MMKSRSDGLILKMDGLTTRNKGYPRRSGYPRVDRDFYVEPRWVVHLLLNVETFIGTVHDPCCGTGTIPSVCMERGLIARHQRLGRRQWPDPSVAEQSVHQQGDVLSVNRHQCCSGPILGVPHER